MYSGRDLWPQPEAQQTIWWAFACDQSFWKKDDPVSMYLNDIFTVPVNLAGLPAISIPAGHDAAGYPLGLQIIGKAFKEQEILNLAYAMEDKINFKNKITDWWIK